MPRYFFDVHDGEHHNRDDSGVELPSVAHVWEIAVGMVDDIARAEYGGTPSRTISVVVRDVCDAVVYRSNIIGRQSYGCQDRVAHALDVTEGHNRTADTTVGLELVDFGDVSTHRLR